MKVVLLAGGLGTRLGEETGIRPKPMIEIGGKPIIWHIMKMYSHYGYNDFIILCGYKHEYIKDYFTNYYLNTSDITIDLANNHIEKHAGLVEPWKVTLLNTGIKTQTGGRLKKAQKYLNNERFMLTYGDGLADIDIPALLHSHEQAGTFASVTAVQPEGRFGLLGIENNNKVSSFQEKPKTDNAWINGGFFVVEPEIFNYISDDDACAWEHEPLRKLAIDGQLNAYKHKGFWRSMDMLKDKLDLNAMWQNKAPWKIWD